MAALIQAYAYVRPSRADEVGLISVGLILLSKLTISVLKCWQLRVIVVNNGNEL